MLIEFYTVNPIDVFHKLCSKPYGFWLDSCGISRYSFAGADPFILIKARNNKVEIIQDSICRIITGNIFSTLTSLLNEFNPPPPPGRNRNEAGGVSCPGQGGAVGYFGYDLKNQLEQLPRKRAAEPNIPDCILGIYDTIFVYDHKINKGYVIASGLSEKNSRSRKLLAKKRANQFFDTMDTGCNLRSPSSPTQHPHPSLEREGKAFVRSNFTKKDYMNTIKRAQRYIAAGDIYQANLSQRLTIEFRGNPLSLYSNLRTISPSQFGAFLNYGDFQVISNSPERLLKVNNDIAETSPIKGTRPRGKTPKTDKALMRELRTSTKELAEHIMIVDLERNDLGKICEYDSIKVWPLQKVYTYATLHHMVSTIKGTLRDKMDPVDCIRSLFPGGSVTGAPKIRAMEIIEELEPMPRGIYTGAIGYIDFCGNMDLSMAIRTAVLKDKKIYLHVGGGIVADSNPEEEYEETMLKANAFFKAMGIGMERL
jgi:para-aminobenzoate synthetase component 1